MCHWIVRTDQTLTEDVPAAPATVRDFYVNLENMKVVHPLVVSVRQTSRRESADGFVHDYRVGDRIPLGKWVLPISYQVRLQVPVEGAVISTARQFPQVRLDGTVSFDAIETGTRIVERLRIAAPLPIAGVTTRRAVQAHSTMLAALRRHFASGS